MTAKIVFLALLCMPAIYIFRTLFGKLIEEYEVLRTSTSGRGRTR